MNGTGFQHYLRKALVRNILLNLTERWYMFLNQEWVIITDFHIDPQCGRIFWNIKNTRGVWMHYTFLLRKKSQKLSIPTYKVNWWVFILVETISTLANYCTACACAKTPTITKFDRIWNRSCFQLVSHSQKTVK